MHVPMWGIPMTLKYSPTLVLYKAFGKVRVEDIPL